MKHKAAGVPDMTLTPRRIALLLLLATLPACQAQDPSIRTATPAELQASDCDSLATEYAQVLERRTTASLAEVSSMSAEEATDAVWAELRGAHVAVSNRLEELQESGRTCELEAFRERTEASFSDRFKEGVPPYLSSTAAGNTWEDYRDIIRDSLEEALAPPAPDVPQTGSA